jgi:hypothetical protein
MMNERSDGSRKRFVSAGLLRPRVYVRRGVDIKRRILLEVRRLRREGKELSGYLHRAGITYAHVRYWERSCSWKDRRV